MRGLLRAVGFLLFFGAGAATYVFEIMWFYRWWDTVGAIVGAVAAPVAVLFPFIYLVKEGFSVLYFGLWGIALAGVALVGVVDD